MLDHMPVGFAGAENRRREFRMVGRIGEALRLEAQAAIAAIGCSIEMGGIVELYAGLGGQQLHAEIAVSRLKARHKLRALWATPRDDEGIVIGGVVAADRPQ